MEFLFLRDGGINEVFAHKVEEGSFAAGVGCGHFYDGVVDNFRFLGRNGRTASLLVFLQVVDVDTRAAGFVHIVLRSDGELVLGDFVLGLEFLGVVNLFVFHDLGDGELDGRLYGHLFDGFLVFEFFGFLLLLLFLGLVFLELRKFGHLLGIHVLALLESSFHGRLGDDETDDGDNHQEYDDDGAELEFTLIGAMTISSVLFVTSFEYHVAPLA